MWVRIFLRGQDHSSASRKALSLGYVIHKLVKLCLMKEGRGDMREGRSKEKRKERGKINVQGASCDCWLGSA